LKRTRVGPIADRKLRPGEWRELKADEVAALKKAAAKPLKSAQRAGSRRPGRPE